MQAASGKQSVTASITSAATRAGCASRFVNEGRNSGVTHSSATTTRGTPHDVQNAQPSGENTNSFVGV